MLERLAEKNADKVKIIKVDVRSEREWAAKEKIRGVPAFQFYRGGKKIKSFSGAPPEENLQQMIDHYASIEAPVAEQPAIQPMPKDWLPPGVSRK